MAKIKIHKNRCKACGLCIIFCPKKNIKSDTVFNDSGVFPAMIVCQADCTGCGMCYVMCPEACIEIETET